jgi:hypothetical protein
MHDDRSSLPVFAVDMLRSDALATFLHTHLQLSFRASTHIFFPGYRVAILVKARSTVRLPVPSVRLISAIAMHHLFTPESMSRLS